MMFDIIQGTIWNIWDALLPYLYDFMFYIFLGGGVYIRDITEKTHGTNLHEIIM